MHEARGAEPVGEPETAGAEQPHGEMQRRRKGRDLQVESRRGPELEREPHQRHLRVHADDLHQAERLGVRTDEDVLPVVEVHAVERDAARPAAELPRRFEHHHPRAVLDQRDRGGHARPACADHRHPRRVGSGHACQAVKRVKR